MTTPSEELLEVNGLAKRYGASWALHPTSLRIAAGEFVCVLGASGCGKSTLLSLLMGIATHDGGSIHLAGRRVDDQPPESRDMAMVFQSHALFGHMSVRRNLTFGLRMKKVPADEQRRRVDEMIDLCRLGDYVDRMPAQLSGGQQQRVALARALVMHAAITLYDEPLSNLDPKLRQSMRDDIARLHRKMHRAALFVTHDATEAMVMADRIIVMHGGRIVETGTPESLYREPKRRVTAELFGAGNLIEVALAREAAILPGGLSVPLSSATDAGKRHGVAVIREESIRLVRNEQGIATVTERQFVGALVKYQVDLHGFKLSAIADGNSIPLIPGTRVDVRFEQPLHLLDDATVSGIEAQSPS
jgi:putative spermidine/putrescine transport system ATP-binding protein